MTLPTLAKLVKSLSGPEKRYFKLHSHKQKGTKEYLALFDIIDKSPTADVKSIKDQFKKKRPSNSLNNTTRYLSKLLTDALIESKTEKDNFFQLLHEIMRVKILQERSLHEASYTLLKKLRKSATLSQQYLIEYFTYREELNYLAEYNFRDINDRLLIETQMKAKDILRSINHIHDHHSLFEILKYRLIHSGKISSEEEKKKLNDLILSEMALLSGKSKNSFSSKKLHLLFQSFFFSDIGDYQSALNTFRSLNTIFENNLDLLDKPPLDYLSALTGILDSLHTLKKFTEIDYFITKLRQLDKPDYPDYFRYQVLKTITIYQFVIFTGEKRFSESVQHVKQGDQSILKMYMVNEEKQWELYFYYSLAYFGNGEWKKAHKLIGEVMRDHKIQPHLLICKATWLLNIILYYQQGDLNYIEYEIRSYKRFFRKQNALRSEKLLLKFLSAWPQEKRKRIPDIQFKKIKEEIIEIESDRYERQLLKYFDFCEWLLEKINR